MRKIIVVPLLLLIFVAGHAQQKNFIDQPYVDVNGYADTTVTPDEIYIRIMIAEADTKNKVSVEDQEAQMVDALKTIGINTEKDLTTNDIASNFRYYFLKGKDVLKTKVYILKVTDAVMLTKAILQLENLGISNTSIERVNYSDIENLRIDIKSKAIANAKAKALALTKPINQTVGNAIYIGEAANNNESDLNAYAGTISIRGYASKNGIVETPKINFEKIKVTANVNVKFILK